MTPKEFVEGLTAVGLPSGLTVVDGPHIVSDQKAVVYIQDVQAIGSPRLRIEVTQ